MAEIKKRRTSEFKDKAVQRLSDLMGYGQHDFMFYEDDPYVFDTYRKYGVVVQCPEAWNYLMPEGKENDIPFTVSR